MRNFKKFDTKFHFKISYRLGQVAQMGVLVQ